jgi:hypothetical protein
MKQSPDTALKRWMWMYLGVGITMTSGWIEGSKLLPPPWPVLSAVVLIVIWGPGLFLIVDKRATSSLCAGIVSLLWFLATLYIVTTTDFLFALPTVMFAVFYLFGSKKTWKLRAQKTGEERKSRP